MEQQNINSMIQCLNCKGNNKVRLFCSMSECQQSALVCTQVNCQCMNLNHRRCNLVNAQALVNDIYKKKRQIQASVLQGFEQLDNLYKNAIQQLSDSRNKILMIKQNYGLNSDEIEFIYSVKNNHKDFFTGNKVYAVRKTLQKQYTLQWFNKEWVNNFLDKKKWAHTNIFQKVNFFTEFQSQCIVPQINSQILCYPDKIISLFATKISKFTKLYQASQWQFSVNKFHQICDGKRNTLVLASTGQQIIGGFTPIPWGKNKRQVEQQVPDEQQKSFIFSITTGKKFQLLDSKFAIKNDPELGPCFGKDLCIGKSSATQKNSKSQFPSSYGCIKQKSANLVSVSPFLILEWEVFEVYFPEQ